jgi:DNA-binding CsgD family transcriptional regulator
MTGVIADAQLGGGSRFFELEYGIDDFLSQRDLARSPPHAGALSHATDGRLDRSVRWRELMEPYGVGDQLRAALVSEGRCWGYLALLREAGGRSFDAADVRFVASVTRAIGDGLRRAATMGFAPHPVPSAPAIVLLAPDLSLTSVSRSVASLLGEEMSLGAFPPAGILAVAARAKASSNGQASARMRGQSSWLTLSAMQIDVESNQVAVVIQASRPAEVVDLLAAVWNLTPRETEITRLVLTGQATAGIGDALHVSPFTVQQHLKSIFDKVGVRSRRELVARVFADHYQPLIG